MKLKSKISCSARSKVPHGPIQPVLDTHIKMAKRFSNFEFDYEDVDCMYGQVDEYMPLYGR